MLWHGNMIPVLGLGESGRTCMRACVRPYSFGSTHPPVGTYASRTLDLPVLLAPCLSPLCPPCRVAAPCRTCTCMDRRGRTGLSRSALANVGALMTGQATLRQYLPRRPLPRSAAEKRCACRTWRPRLADGRVRVVNPDLGLDVHRCIRGRIVGLEVGGIGRQTTAA